MHHIHLAQIESSIIEKAYALTSIGGQYGNQKPTDFICLVLKLLQIQPRDEIVFKYITGLTESENNKQVPYVFMTFSGSEVCFFSALILTVVIVCCAIC